MSNAVAIPKGLTLLYRKTRTGGEVLRLLCRACESEWFQAASDPKHGVALRCDECWESNRPQFYTNGRCRVCEDMPHRRKTSGCISCKKPYRPEL